MLVLADARDARWDALERAITIDDGPGVIVVRGAVCFDLERDDLQELVTFRRFTEEPPDCQEYEHAVEASLYLSSGEILAGDHALALEAGIWRRLRLLDAPSPVVELWPAQPAPPALLRSAPNLSRQVPAAQLYRTDDAAIEPLEVRYYQVRFQPQAPGGLIEAGLASGRLRRDGDWLVFETWAPGADSALSEVRAYAGRLERVAVDPADPGDTFVSYTAGPPPA